MMPPPPRSTLFPYTTLFRSALAARGAGGPWCEACAAAPTASVASRMRVEIVRMGTVRIDRKSTRLNSSHLGISYAVFCLKKKKDQKNTRHTIKRDQAS